MKIETDRDKWLFTILVSAVSVFASLLLTWLATGGTQLARQALIPALLVPLIVAPVASHYAAVMMLRLYRLNRDMDHLLRHDHMTGLLNRRAFFEMFDADGIQGALLMLDIDNFKAINDTYGHHVGDDMIVSVAQMLKQLMPQGGRAARFGGDEFVVFLSDMDLESAQWKAEEIRYAIEQSDRIIRGFRVKCTMSIGVEQIDSPDQIDRALGHADQALYRAKSAGRNAVATRGHGPTCSPKPP